jgi:hypothetical protein
VCNQAGAGAGSEGERVNAGGVCIGARCAGISIDIPFSIDTSYIIATPFRIDIPFSIDTSFSRADAPS